MSEKICVFCEHFTMDTGWEDGTADTGGTPAAIWCGNAVQEDFQGMSLNERDFRKWILKAGTCAEYSRLEEQNDGNN